MAIEYPITRPILIRWFAPVVYVLVFIAVVLLSILNVALVGYETVTVFEPNPNYTQSEWYDTYLPMRRAKAGSLCDPVIFNVGDSFATNYSLFQWTIESIPRSNTGGTGVLYKGTPLDHCDITSLYITGDLRSYSIDYTGIITCKAAEGYVMRAKTAFSISALYGRYSPLQGQVGAKSIQEGGIYDPSTDEPRSFAFAAVMTLASNDTGDRIATMYVLSNGTTPSLYSLQVDFPFCPASLGTSAQCATSAPTFNISSVSVGYADLNLQQYVASRPIEPLNTPLITTDVEGPLANIIQVIAAGVRMDLGNPSPNNLFLNNSAVDGALLADFPATENAPFTESVAYNIRKYPATAAEGSQLDTIFPLNVSGPGVARIPYACRSQRRKSPGSLFVSVLVATLTMTSSGWAAFMLVATTWIKRRDPQANACSPCAGGSPHPVGGTKHYEPVSY